MMHSKPPKVAEKLLSLFLKEEFIEEVLGDLDEKFQQTLEKTSRRNARFGYWYQVINYLRPFAFKSFKSTFILETMTTDHFKISYRFLTRNKGFSIINIGGIALGMVVSLLISLWVHDELSFNMHFKKYDRIVQVYRKDISEKGEVSINTSMVGQAGIFMKEHFSSIFNRVTMTFFRERPQLLTVGRQSYDQKGYFFHPDAPDMLSLEMVSGTRNGIDAPDGILLSESLAHTFFGDQNPIGKLVNLNVQKDLLVTGVFKDLPKNGAFANASFIASMELIYNEQNPYSWHNQNMRIYAELKEGVSVETASEMIKNMMDSHGSTPENESRELFLVPMKDWHLHAAFEAGFPVLSKRMQFVIMYSIIGAIVLLLACINFMNLNTARFQDRGKEVGVRKILGSQRKQLISQFLTESMLYAFASFILCLLIVWFILPWFNTLSGKDLTIPWTHPVFWLIGLSFTCLTAFLAGSYPALFLSSFRPIKALNGQLKQGVRSVRMRQVLVVFQFTISILLVISTITVYQQIQHAKARPVGYDQEGLITVRGRTVEFIEKYETLREALKGTGMVEEMATANYPLMTTLGNNDGFKLEETNERYDFSFNTIFVSPEYGKALEWELLAGRDFSRNHGDESQNIIISELAVEKMGLKDPIGKRLSASWSFRGRKKELTIIGVVKDMIKGSPYEPARPLMVFASRQAESFLFIRIKEGKPYIDALPAIEETFESVLSDHPFHYEFVDDSYALKFQEEEKTGSLAALFSGVAILISCLGLFGLSAFVVSQRTKEIGIRKVLGASTLNLWKLLSWDFSLLVFISFALAVPIASVLLSNWLESYEYRVEIGWWVYAVSGLGSIVIAWSTISFHSLKASFTNPTDSLRAE